MLEDLFFDDLDPRYARVELHQEQLSKKELFQPHHGLTGGVYKARERIHRAMADARLLANPASRSRVPDSDPN